MEVVLGGVVFIYHVDVDVSRRRGAAGYQRRARTAGHVQDGGAVWRHGGVNGRPFKVDAWIPLEDGFVKDGGSDPNAVGLLDRCCSFFVNGRIERHSVFLCCALV